MLDTPCCIPVPICIPCGGCCTLPIFILFCFLLYVYRDNIRAYFSRMMPQMVPPFAFPKNAQFNQIYFQQIDQTQNTFISLCIGIMFILFIIYSVIFTIQIVIKEIKHKFKGKKQEEYIEGDYKIKLLDS